MVKKISQNIAGKIYVNTHCINCSLCAEILPDVFATNHDEGVEYVKKQPENKTEHKLVAEAMQLCPANAIRNDG